MATFKVEDVPEDLLHGLRMEAAAGRTTVRALTLAWLEQVTAGENQCTQPSPNERSGLKSKPRTKKQGKNGRGGVVDAVSPTVGARAGGLQRGPEADSLGKITHARVKHCSHGLYFHPGCTD